MNPAPLILIVDDQAANREVLIELLEPEGYRLVEASRGSEALQLAAVTSPDLVLLDVMMPQMDGIEVCRRLRTDETLAEVPVIMVTALEDQASRLAGLNAGADDFISKPYNRAELRARVRTITRLNRYRRLSEQRTQFQWVVEHALDGYVLVNAADEILFANDRARLWLGLQPTQTHQAPEKFLAATSRTFMGQPTALWQGWPAIPTETLASARLLVRPETPQARAFFLEVSLHETPGKRLLRLRDVTERLAARRDQRSFQTMVCHKLRTPLNGIVGSLGLLATDAASLSPSEVAEFSSMAQLSAERLSGAVEDVLRFAEISKLPSGAGFALGGLEEMARRVAASLGIESCHVSVPPEAMADALPWPRPGIEWALCELMENAKKFHPRHAPTVEVSVRIEGKDGRVLAVGDDGMALSPEQLAQVGMPYFQGEKSHTGEAPGMGLGLAAVAALAWQVGGSFRVRNQTAGPGICVELRWPRADGAAAPPK